MQLNEPTAVFDVAQAVLLNARRLPVCYGALQLLSGLAFLTFVILTGQDAVMFGAVMTLCFAGAFQTVMFTVLYFKCARRSTCRSDIFDITGQLNFLQPALMIGLVSPLCIMLFFIAAVAVTASCIASSANDNDDHEDFRSRYYSIGLEVAIIICEICPALIHHDLLVKIKLITAAVSDMASRGILRISGNWELGLRSNVGMESGSDRERLTVYEFLAEPRYSTTNAHGAPPHYDEIQQNMPGNRLGPTSEGQGTTAQADSGSTICRAAEESLSNLPPVYIISPATNTPESSNSPPPLYSSVEFQTDGSV